MKPCGACGRSLARESFSKKQWQANKRRRCKNCIANDRQAVSETELSLASLSLGDIATDNSSPEPRSDNPQMPGRDDDRGAETRTDEDLFRQPPQREDCPICFLRMPLIERETLYQSCCGKIICLGCAQTSFEQSSAKRRSCPFCRTPEPLTEQEDNERLMKRAKDNDPDAMCSLGYDYSCGSRVLPRDHGKAMELWLRAGELGSAKSYHDIGEAYRNGDGVKANMEKAKYYYTLAAIGGCVGARFNLGTMELRKGDADRAAKHYMISAGCGDDCSVAAIRKLYAQGRVSKGVYENALRAYGEDRAETKSDQRDAAARDPRFVQWFTSLDR